MARLANPSESLAVYLKPRVLVLGALGFSSGLPYLLTSSTLGAWLANEHVDLATIGLFALVTAPYTVKFLWAPLLDRFRPPWLGRRRGWIALAQIALAVAVCALAFARPRASPLAAAALALAVAFASATQDVACDAYSVEILAAGERAAGGAVFVLGYRVAMLVTGALALIAADYLGFKGVYLASAALIGLSVAFTLIAPEPAPAAPPTTIAAAIVEPFADFFARPGALAALAFVTLYRLGELVAANMVTPFLVSLQFSNSEIGAVWKGVGLVATIAGALGGGALTARLGLRRALFVFGSAQAIANLGYAVLAVAGRRHALLVAAVAADQTCSGFTIASAVALSMALCNRRYAATQFALLTSAAGATARLVGAGAGFYIERVGWPAFFITTAIAALPALLILSLSKSLQKQL